MTSYPLRRSSLLVFLAILVVALWLRAPFVRTGLPYFYDEDEAHHYDRVLAMVKKGEFNPNYFLKPSLHFYLRMPVAAFGFLASVRAGEVLSLKEVVTKDQFGLAGYSFSAFPQKIAKWSRGFSLLWSLLVVALTYAITFKISNDRFAATIAALLAAVAPPLVYSSATIGVDGIVCALALATTLLSIRALEARSLQAIAIAGIVAGLTVGTKYNAAPIALVPLAAVMLSRGRSNLGLTVAAITPILGFIISTPYLFANLPLFLDHIASEIWHYGIAGHENHMAEPGIAQIKFYLGWLSATGIGYVAMIFAVTGIASLTATTRRPVAILLLFPLLYFLLMISQKANFTRNMHVIIPYLAIAVGFAAMHAATRAKELRWIGITAIVLAITAQPFYGAFQSRTEAQSVTESRVGAAEWLRSRKSEVTRTAVAGELQFEPTLFKDSAFVRTDRSKESIEQLIEQGFERLVTGATELPRSDEERFLSSEIVFPGDTATQRIVKNPEIHIYRIKH